MPTSHFKTPLVSQVTYDPNSFPNYPAHYLLQSLILLFDLLSQSIIYYILVVAAGFIQLIF